MTTNAEDPRGPGDMCGQWQGPGEDAQGRKWYLADLADEVMPPSRSGPADWLDVILAFPKWFPPDKPIKFIWSRQLPNVTVRSGQGNLFQPGETPPPADIPAVPPNTAFYPMSGDDILWGAEEVRAWLDEHGDGEAETFECYQWSADDDSSLTFMLENGALVPCGSA